MKEPKFGKEKVYFVLGIGFKKGSLLEDLPCIYRISPPAIILKMRYNKKIKEYEYECFIEHGCGYSPNKNLKEFAEHLERCRKYDLRPVRDHIVKGWVKESSLSYDKEAIQKECSNKNKLVPPEWL